MVSYLVGLDPTFSFPLLFERFSVCHNRGNHLNYERDRQTTMEDIDGGLHPAVDGQSLDEDEVAQRVHQGNTQTTARATNQHVSCEGGGSCVHACRIQRLVVLSLCQRGSVRLYSKVISKQGSDTDLQ